MDELPTESTLSELTKKAASKGSSHRQSDASSAMSTSATRLSSLRNSIDTSIGGLEEERDAPLGPPPLMEDRPEVESNIRITTLGIPGQMSPGQLSPRVGTAGNFMQARLRVMRSSMRQSVRSARMSVVSSISSSVSSVGTPRGLLRASRMSVTSHMSSRPSRFSRSTRSTLSSAVSSAISSRFTRFTQMSMASSVAGGGLMNFTFRTHLNRASTESNMMEDYQTFRDCMNAETPMARLFHILRLIKTRWENFTLFGINREDDTPSIWGHRIASGRRLGTMQLEGGRHSSARMSSRRSIHKMVKQHRNHEEMRLQLRDEQVKFHFLDTFSTDTEPGRFMIRVFSQGATLMEYAKMAIAAYTFMFALTITAFWRILQSGSLAMDFYTDFVYGFLLILQLRTTLLEARWGREICTPRKIMRRHFSDIRFWMDALSCVPIQALQQASWDGDVVRWLMLLKVARCWRMFRIPPKQRFMPSLAFSMVRIPTLLVMGAHFCACLWFMIIFENEGTKMAYRTDGCGTGQEGTCLLNFYMLSMHVGFRLVLGAQSDARSPLGNFYITLCLPLGCFVLSYLQGEIILQLERRNSLETQRNDSMLMKQEAMRVLGLPPALQIRVLTYSTYERLNRSGRLFNALFANLSPQLRFELQLHMYLDLVLQAGLFRNMRPRVIREVIVTLEDVIFLPGDWICRFGDYGDSMYFIVGGQCAVVGKDTVTELKILSRGDYFGEVALLTGVPRTAHVRANRFCICAHLTKDAFAPILQKWPEEMDVLLGGMGDSERNVIKEQAYQHFGLKSPNGGPGSSMGFAAFRRGSMWQEKGAVSPSEDDGLKSLYGKAPAQEASEVVRIGPSEGESPSPPVFRIPAIDAKQRLSDDCANSCAVVKEECEEDDDEEEKDKSENEDEEEEDEEDEEDDEEEDSDEEDSKDGDQFSAPSDSSDGSTIPDGPFKDSIAAAQLLQAQLDSLLDTLADTVQDAEQHAQFVTERLRDHRHVILEAIREAVAREVFHIQEEEEEEEEEEARRMADGGPSLATAYESDEEAEQGLQMVI